MHYSGVNQNTFNPIAFLDIESVQRLKSDLLEKQQLLSTVAIVYRLASATFGFFCIYKIGKINPHYIPISIFILLLSYKPIVSFYIEIENLVIGCKNTLIKFDKIINKLEDLDRTNIEPPFPIYYSNGLSLSIATKLQRSITAQSCVCNDELEQVGKEINDLKIDLNKIKTLLSQKNSCNESTESLLNEFQNLSIQITLLFHQKNSIKLEKLFLYHLSLNPKDKRKISDFGNFLPINFVKTYDSEPPNLPFFKLKDGTPIVPEMLDFTDFTNIYKSAEHIFFRE